jgi:glycerol-3-phosphate dehydrogenase (NAD(P)+)
MRVTVLGAGAWGTAMAACLAPRHRVVLWTRDPLQCALMQQSRVNARYLPGHVLPAGLELTHDLAAAAQAGELLLVAVPTAGLRETLHLVRAAGASAPLVWLCKGFERPQARLPHQIAAEALGPTAICGVLSGPSFADEVVRGLPAAVTLASSDVSFAGDTARVLHGPTLRVYSSDDVTGVEVAGAVKNVMAIAVGVCDGLSLGYSARAALITRGLAEMTRLGLKLGGRIETFMGLAGAGDLILTCTSDLSRNRRVGLALARGATLAAALSELGHVAEGVYSAREVDRVATDLGIEMPITRAVCRVLDDPSAAAAAVKDLLQREQKAER